MILAGCAAALVVVPRNSAALVALVFAVIAPSAILVSRGQRGTWPGRRTLILGAMILGLSLLSVVTGAFATAPSVSLLGARGQHTGAILWVGAASTLAAMTWTWRPGDLRRTVRAVSVFGALLGLAAGLERAGLLTTFRLSDSPSGLVENSISLAQVMLVALGTSAAWALRSKLALERIGGWVTFGFCLAGLTISRTRAGWLAIAVVASVLGVVWLLRRTPISRPAVVASISVAVAAAVLAGTVWLGIVGVDHPLASKADEALSGRVGIWTAAVSKVGRTWLLGSGPEQFTAWASWTSVPGVSLEFTATDDPHSILLYWLLAAGVPGLLLALAALWFFSERIATTLRMSGWRGGSFVLALALGSWAFSLSFAWTSPLALLCAAVVLGGVLGELEGASRNGGTDIAEKTAPASDARLRWTPGLAALAAAGIAIGLAAPAMGAEIGWATRIREALPTTPEMLVAASEASGDPAYAAEAAAQYHTQLVQSRDLKLIDEFNSTARDILVRHSTWSVNAALQVNQITSDSSSLEPQTTWEDVEKTLEVARRTEPTTGLWDYLGAVEALLLSEKDAAQEHARAALRHPLPDSVRTWCEEIAQGEI